MIKYIFGAIVIAVVFVFKPITSHFIEEHASKLLEQNVKVTSLSIVPLRADAYIAESNNTISANIISIYPLKLRAYYSGDIDAFKKYHPLKGYGEANAIIIYDDKLLVDGEASLYGAKAKVIVKELKENWFVGVDATSLKLRALQEQNAKEVKADAEVDFELKLYTDANVSVSLHTKAINISGKHIKDVDIKLLREKENFKLESLFIAPNFYKTNLDANATLKDGEILASTNIAFKDVKIFLDKLKINTKTLQTSLHTSFFGGNLDATFKENMLYYDAKDMHLSKLLKVAEQKPMARGYLNLKGELDVKTLDAKLFFSSPWIVASKQRVEHIKLNIPNLKYKDKELNTSYELSAAFMKKLFTFKGDIHFKNILKLDAKSKDFGGKTELLLKDKEFELSMKKLNLQELQKFASIKPQISGLIDLDAKGNFEKINFKASVALEGDLLEVRGDASYKKQLILNAYSSSFESKTFLKLEDEHFKFSTKDINVHKLTNALKKPTYFFGYIDFEAQGNFKEIDFRLRSKGIKRNLDLGEINNYISLNLRGHYTPELLTLRDNLVLNYEKEHLPITIDAKIGLKAPYKSHGSFVNRNDKITLNSFSYEKEQIKSNLLVDIQDLYAYRAMFENPLHGPLKVKANYTDALNIVTNSLGGELSVNLNKSYVDVKLQNIELTKVAHMMAKDNVFESGLIEGSANYNIKEKSAKSDISLKNSLLNGINIDKKISNLNDAIGLNVLSMSKSIFSDFSGTSKEQTNIEHLQFNLSLKDKNIKLDDVAMSTKHLLFVALGDLKQNGDINSLDVSILDNKGCAIITQALKGNIKNPKTEKTTSTLVNIVENVPSALLNTGKGLLDFATGTIDSIASFGTQTILRSDANVSITSDIVSGSSKLIKYTSDVVMPKGCKIIYNGRVKHPLKTKDK